MPTTLTATRAAGRRVVTSCSRRARIASLRCAGPLTGAPVRHRRRGSWPVRSSPVCCRSPASWCADVLAGSRRRTCLRRREPEPSPPRRTSSPVPATRCGRSPGRVPSLRTRRRASATTSTTLVDLNGGASIEVGRATCCLTADACARPQLGACEYRCPACIARAVGADDTKVVDSRLAEEGAAVRRRRAMPVVRLPVHHVRAAEAVPLPSSSPTGRRSRSTATRSSPVCGRRRRAVTCPDEQSSSSPAGSRTGSRVAGRRGDERRRSGSPCSSGCARSTRSPICASPASTRTSTPPPTSSASSSCSTSSSCRRTQRLNRKPSSSTSRTASSRSTVVGAAPDHEARAVDRRRGAARS